MTTGAGALALLLLSTLPLLSTPSAGLGQVPDLDRVRSAFPAATASRIEGVIQSALREGIPPDLLVGKALEGAAKGVSGEELERALVEYAERLRRARGLLGPEAGPSSLETAAEALRRGVPPDAVRGLSREHPAHFDMLLTVFGDLLSAGAPAESAREIVEQATREGMEEDRLLGLPGALRRRIRAGASPGEAASAILEDLRQGKDPIPPGVRRVLRRVSESLGSSVGAGRIPGPR